MENTEGMDFYTTVPSLRLVRTQRMATKKRPTASEKAKGLTIPGFTRNVGNYGRYGNAALELGLQPELKFFDTGISYIYDKFLNDPGKSLNLMPQGDTESTRDGRSAWIKSIQVRGLFEYTTGFSTHSDNCVHMWLVLDMQANGTQAATDNVFMDYAPGDWDGGRTMLNLDNSSRFRVIKEWIVSMNAKAGLNGDYDRILFPIEYYKKCNIKVEWSGTTGAITEVRSNNIFLCFGTEIEPNQGNVQFYGNCRVRFQG